MQEDLIEINDTGHQDLWPLFFVTQAFEKEDPAKEIEAMEESVANELKGLMQQVSGAEKVELALEINRLYSRIAELKGRP